MIGANGEPVQSRVEQDKGRVNAAIKALIPGKHVQKVMWKVRRRNAALYVVQVS